MPRFHSSKQTVNTSDLTNNTRSRRQQKTEATNDNKQMKATNEKNNEVNDLNDEKEQTELLDKENINKDEDTNSENETEDQNENHDTSNIQDKKQDNDEMDENSNKMNVDKKKVENETKTVKGKKVGKQVNGANAAKSNIVLDEPSHSRKLMTPKKVPRDARVTKGRSVELTIKGQQLIGWIKDQKNGKILIRWTYLVNNNVHFEEQWFSKNDKNLHIFDRRYDAHLNPKKQ